MTTDRMNHRVENGTVLILEREFDAPQQLVFEAFTECRHLKHWWGPRGFELTHCDMDLRPGGSWHYCMTGVGDNLGEYQGMESWGKAIFSEINAPVRLDYTDYFSDAEGTLNDSMPASKISVEFKAAGGRTTVINRAEYVSAEALQQVLDMGMLQGITETWDRLEEHLEQAG